MRKFTLSLTMLMAGAMAVWAQEPVLLLDQSQIGAYPYELDETSANSVFELDDLTIAVQIDAPATVSGRKALFATSDPTQGQNSTAEGTNSRYVAYGMNGDDVGYLASWLSGDRFTGGDAITANAEDMIIVYVVNPTNKTFKAYVNGAEKFSKVNAHNDGFMSGYEIATPKMVKADHANAKIYLGGGKYSEGDGEVFEGKIKSVRVYSGALTAEQIAAIKPIFFLDEELATLDATILEAKTLFDGIEGEIGEGVGKYSTNPDYMDELAAIEEFRASVENTTTPEEVVAKTAEVNALIASVQLNMPEAGKFYTFKNDDYYITSSTIATGNRNIALSATKDATAIYYYDGSHLLAYTTGLYIGLDATDWGFEAVGSNNVSVIEFIAAANGAVAKYNIKSGGRWLHRTDAYVNRCSSNTCGDAHNWTIEEVTELPATIGTVGYATLHAPVALTIPAGVKAYTGALNGEWLTLNEVSTTIPANTAVILEATETLAEATTFNFTVAADVAAINENALSGTIEAVAKADTHYTLQSHNGGVAFKQYTGANLSGFKAYLNLPTETAAIGIRFEDGTTAIDNVQLSTDNVVIYDLAGRRVEKMEKGIYIVNGKKVVIK